MSLRHRATSNHRCTVLLQKLTPQTIHPLDDLLEGEGANGQTVPYTGYIEVSITFPKSFLGVDIEVPTLALVVPDC